MTVGADAVPRQYDSVRCLVTGVVLAHPVNEWVVGVYNRYLGALGFSCLQDSKVVCGLCSSGAAECVRESCERWRGQVNETPAWAEPVRRVSLRLQHDWWHRTDVLKCECEA